MICHGYLQWHAFSHYPGLCHYHYTLVSRRVIFHCVGGGRKGPFFPGPLSYFRWVCYTYLVNGYLDHGGDDCIYS